jgi:hypothetical protein
MSFDHFMQSPVLLAIAGAVAGGLRAGVMSWRKNGKLRAFSDGLIGMVFAVGMADWLTPPAYPKAAALIGLLAGTTGARALDAFFELAPELVRELALGWARKITGSRGVDSVRRNTGWGDLTRRGPVDDPDGGPHEHR